MSPSDHVPMPIVKTETLTDPYVTAGRHAYLIGQQDGSFPDLGWHVRGEMGGLWSHPIKLLDGLWLRVDGTWLAAAHNYRSGPFWSEHAYALPGDLTVTRRQFVPDGERGLVMRYTFRSPSPRTLQLRLVARSDLQGVWMSEEGGIHDGYDHAAYDEALGAWVCRDDWNPWYVVVGACGAKPSAVESGRDLWGPDRTGGFGISVALDYTLALDAGEDAVLEVVVAGSDAGLVPAREGYLRIREGIAAAWAGKSSRYAAMLSRSALQIPDPSIVRAWDWVKCNYDWLMRDVPPLGRGLGAGVPDYPWWFGCDNAYALRGCLALGQHDIAVDTLDLLRVISVRRNGDSGRVIHESNTRGYVNNPGNTQETPHLARAVWDAFLWTGDLEFLQRMYPFCKRGVLEWTLGTKCPDGDILPYGYGVIELKHLNLQCLDTATLAAEALAALAGMAETLGEDGVAARCRALHEAVRQRLDAAFWIEAEGLYGDMVATPAEMAPRIRYWLEQAENPDSAGRMTAEAIAGLQRLLDEALSDPDQERKRPWLCKNWTVLCPLEAGLTPPEQARRVLERVESPEFTGRWGMYLSGIERSRSMSINTGVLAVAEAQYGRAEQALHYVRLLTDTLELQMPGAIAEMSPDYGCCVQAWSGYSVAWPLVAGIFGLRPDALRRRLELEPAFPAAWMSAALTGVRVGNNTFDLQWDGQTLHVTSHETGWTVTSQRVPIELATSAATGWDAMTILAHNARWRYGRTHHSQRRGDPSWRCQRRQASCQKVSHSTAWARAVSASSRTGTTSRCCSRSNTYHAPVA